MAKFSRTYELLCESVDCNDRLRPNSFMSFAQDIADMDVERMGAGFRQLQPKGIAWILARMRFTISEPAVWKEKVLLQTWHRGTQGPFFIRDYVLLGEDGSTKVTGVSSWVILNTGDRTLMKMSDAEGILPAGLCTCQRCFWPRYSEGPQRFWHSPLWSCSGYTPGHR